MMKWCLDWERTPPPPSVVVDIDYRHCYYGFVSIHFSNLLGKKIYLIDAISGDFLSLGNRICNDSKKKRNGSSYSYLIVILLFSLWYSSPAIYVQIFNFSCPIPAPKIKTLLLLCFSFPITPFIHTFILTSSFFKRIFEKFYWI